MCQKYSRLAQDLEDIYNVGGNELFYYDSRGRRNKKYYLAEFRELIKRGYKKN